MEVTLFDEVTSELRKVKEDFRFALQENEGLHAQIGILRARNEQNEHRLHQLRDLVDMFKGYADRFLILSDSE